MLVNCSGRSTVVSGQLYIVAGLNCICCGGYNTMYCRAVCDSAVHI